MRVLMGGFHATLMPEEVKRFADVIITGEAESVWETMIDDLRHGTLQREYHGTQTDLRSIRVDRSLFAGKRYLPIGLVETGAAAVFTVNSVRCSRFISSVTGGAIRIMCCGSWRVSKVQKSVFLCG